MPNPESQFSIECNFMALFRIGDNIQYNIKILNTLYTAYNLADAQQRNLLCKPIIIIIMSIVEALLYDFHHRIKFYTREGIRNMALDAIAYIQSKKIDDLEKYIASARKHGLFDPAHENFYIKLDELRRIRNRIHIQNDRNYQPSLEQNIFIPDNKDAAECVLEIICRTLHRKHPRSVGNFVGTFTFPWSSRFEDLFS